LNLLNGVFLWSTTVLALSCLLLFLPAFTGPLPLFLLGLPFILVIILGLKDERKAQLMKTLRKIECGEGYRRYINYYLTLIELKGKRWLWFSVFLIRKMHIEEDRDAAMTLKGYLNHHSEFCPLDDCPLRNFRKQMLKEARKAGEGYGQFGPSLVQQASMMSGGNAVNL